MERSPLGLYLESSTLNLCLIIEVLKLGDKSCLKLLSYKVSCRKSSILIESDVMMRYVLNTMRKLRILSFWHFSICCKLMRGFAASGAQFQDLVRLEMVEIANEVAEIKERKKRRKMVVSMMKRGGKFARYAVITDFRIGGARVTEMGRKILEKVKGDVIRLKEGEFHKKIQILMIAAPEIGEEIWKLEIARRLVADKEFHELIDMDGIRFRAKNIQRWFRSGYESFTGKKIEILDYQIKLYVQPPLEKIELEYRNFINSVLCKCLSKGDKVSRFYHAPQNIYISSGSKCSRIEACLRLTSTTSISLGLYSPRTRKLLKTLTFTSPSLKFFPFTSSPSSLTLLLHARPPFTLLNISCVSYGLTLILSNLGVLYEKMCLQPYACIYSGKEGVFWILRNFVNRVVCTSSRVFFEKQLFHFCVCDVEAVGRNCAVLREWATGKKILWRGEGEEEEGLWELCGG